MQTIRDRLAWECLGMWRHGLVTRGARSICWWEVSFSSMFVIARYFYFTDRLTGLSTVIEGADARAGGEETCAQLEFGGTNDWSAGSWINQRT